MNGPFSFGPHLLPTGVLWIAKGQKKTCRAKRKLVQHVDLMTVGVNRCVDSDIWGPERFFSVIKLPIWTCALSARASLLVARS